eukprot:1141018-Pelagomonas_calceolata.AAC.3
MHLHLSVLTYTNPHSGSGIAVAGLALIVLSVLVMLAKQLQLHTCATALFLLSMPADWRWSGDGWPGFVHNLHAGHASQAAARLWHPHVGRQFRWGAAVPVHGMPVHGVQLRLCTACILAALCV